MKPITIFIFFLHLFIFVHAQNKDEKSILKVLNDQIEQWNNGSIDKFMDGYWNNDSLCFIGKNGPKYGFKSALENYKKSYPDRATMGKLSFDILKLEKISDVYYSVIGRFNLTRTKGNLTGYFTLLVKKINNQWKIVLDHSS